MGGPREIGVSPEKGSMGMLKLTDETTDRYTKPASADVQRVHSKKERTHRCTDDAHANSVYIWVLKRRRV